LEVKKEISQIESRSSQVIKKINEQQAENRQKYNELLNQIRTVTRRKQLAWVGVVIGGLFLAAAIAAATVWVIRRFGSSKV
jgi:hypothetical protein